MKETIAEQLLKLSYNLASIVSPKIAVAKDQDWDNHTTTYIFDDESTLMDDGDEMIIVPNLPSEEN